MAKVTSRSNHNRIADHLRYLETSQQSFDFPSFLFARQALQNFVKHEVANDDLFGAER